MTIPPSGPSWPADVSFPPVGDGAAADQWIRHRLFDQRRVVLSGVLDDVSGNDLCMELMTLDALGDEAIELTIDCPDGSVTPALAVMDVIDVLGVPVHGHCLGQAIGPSIGILAVCQRRTAAPHVRIRLVEPAVEMTGRARHVEVLVANAQERWTQFCRRVSEATGQPLERIQSDSADGRFLSAEEAVAYGIVDEINEGPRRPTLYR
jgi:ATP-dependent Clp protease, protease subunit